MSSQNGKKQRKNVGAMAIAGYVAPQAEGLEQQIIGVMLEADSWDEDVVNDIKRYLSPEDFYKENHRIICRAVYRIHGNYIKPNILLVAEELVKSEELFLVGGPAALTALNNRVVSSANIERDCLIIKQYSMARRLIRVSETIMQSAYANEDVFVIMEDAEAQIRGINNEVAEMEVTQIESLAVATYAAFADRVHKARKGIIDPNLVYTGMPEWDRLNGPLFPGGVYVIAARPAMGKTAFIIEMMKRMARHVPIGFINGEMTNEQTLIRMGTNIKRLNNVVFKKDPAEVTDNELKVFEEAMEATAGLKLFIDQSIRIDKIVQKIRYWVSKYGIKAAFIDFLQLLQVIEELAKYMSEVQIINYILEQIRCLAKELKIPIFLLSQLNRDLYKRGGNKEPTMSDLKGSGKIEEIAFQIMFLHRPEYYEIFVDDMGESTAGRCDQIIVKHRDGKLDRFKHRFLGEFSAFEEWYSELGTWTPMISNPNKAKGMNLESVETLAFDDGFETDAPF